MEAFGINLQRKVAHESAWKKFSSLEHKYKTRSINNAEIKRVFAQVGDCLKRLITLSCADSGELKNAHNALFLSLIERLRLQDEAEKRRSLRESLANSKDQVEDALD